MTIYTKQPKPRQEIHYVAAKSLFKPADLTKAPSVALDVAIEHSCHSWLPSGHRASWWFPLAVTSRWSRVLQRESGSPRPGDDMGESGPWSCPVSLLTSEPTFPSLLRELADSVLLFSSVPHVCFNVAWTSRCRASSRALDVHSLIVTD